MNELTPIRIVPVILCGGSGTRLWPMSRGGYPKQYLKLAGERTLFQQTVERLQSVTQATAPIIVTGDEQRFLAAEQLRQMDVRPSSILLEPVGRNIAPAIAVAASLALRNAPDALLLVLPSNQLIQNEAAFADLVSTAARAAADDHLVTFGIEPSVAHTGYGYIRAGASLAGHPEARVVDAFVEKPDAQTAEALLAQGNYSWNSGMFMFKASVYLDELRRHAPDIARQAVLSLEHSQQDNDFIRLDAAAFEFCPPASIDHAVMERTERAAVIAATGLAWSDIGSWDALADCATTDDAGNALIGDVLADELKNAYVRAEHRMVAAIGLENVIVVETSDAVLVARRDKVQDVRRIVEHLKASGRRESVTHRRVARPWGSYESIDQGDRFQVKRIVVNPGAQLSLQMHHHRAEHWIVVKGTALVTNGDKDILLAENQSTYIPVGVIHRLRNPGRIPLKLIEVQSGVYLGEDDIVRFEDTYGRLGTD